MSFGEVFNKNRQLVPRWHTYPVASWLGVTASAEREPPKYEPDQDYKESVRSWSNRKDLGYAADLVGNALVLHLFNDESAVTAAEYILGNKSKASKLLLEIAENYLHLSAKRPSPLPEIILPHEDQRYSDAISSLKVRVREYPRNPILWMDLAFYYSVKGQVQSAEHAAKVALSLNSENRYLLRSGSRYFMHTERPDLALYFLRNSVMARHDPWLVAAEVAISDSFGLPSSLIKVAKHMAASDSFSHFHLSELAAALGTVEFKNGASKKGKKLFDLALARPTENTLAQALFLRDSIGEVRIKVSPDELSKSFEADTRLRFLNHEFEAALSASYKWFAYQPFSSWPALAGTYIAAVTLGRFEESIKIARLALNASPDDFMLNNNLAFAMISLGDVAGAIKALESIDEQPDSEAERSVLKATNAAICFRQGKEVEGRKLYKSAVDYFKKENNTRSECNAKLFWTREEGLVGSPDAKTLLREVTESIEKYKYRDLLLPLKNVSAIVLKGSAPTT